MVFVLSPETGTPLYVQIREGLKREIDSGALKPGVRLPSSRQLARDLGVSRITTANAYAELEAEGVVEARPGSGTFVLPSSLPFRVPAAPPVLRTGTGYPTQPAAGYPAGGAELVPVPLDAEGMRADALERALAAPASGGPVRLVYTVPTFHNPTGVVMSPARRREIVRLAARYCAPVFEDDYLREVRFSGPIPPPLAAFDGHGNVIHVGSFSKSLLPALRLGYVVARGALRERLLVLKRVADVGSSALLQRAVHRHLESGELHSHWKRISRVYRRRQAAMAAALRRHFPPTATWTSPQGGVVMWVHTPGASVVRLLDEALAAGVSFGLGSAFFTRPADQAFMRLNFAAIDEVEIERGIATLGRLLVGQPAGG